MNERFGPSAHDYPGARRRVEDETQTVGASVAALPNGAQAMTRHGGGQ